MKLDLGKIFRKEHQVCLALFIITFLSRYLFSEKYFFDGDTVGVALGSISYSLQDTRPHLPGYFLHVKFISILDLLIKDLHLTMLLVSAFYSSLGAALSYLLLKKWFNENTSLLITALVIFNPLVWFQGVSPEVYSFDLLMSASFVLLALDKRGIYFTPIILAIGSGVRQTSGLLLFPLYIFLWYQMIRSKEISLMKFIMAHLLGLSALLIWFVPMIKSTGGLIEYISLYKTNSPLPNINLLQNIFQFSSYCFFVFTPLILLLAPLVFKKKTFNILPDEKKIVQIILFWLIPSLITFILFTYHKGYFLISILPLYASIGILAEKKLLNQSALLLVLVIEIIFFVMMPFRELSFSSIIKPQKRDNNLFNTWVDRTFSSYLMSISRIKYQDETMSELSDHIIKQKLETVFLDPTVYLAARGLQIRFPSVRFITMDYYLEDSFIEYKGLGIAVRKGMKDRLKNTLLITRKDFFESEIRKHLIDELILKKFVSAKINDYSETQLYDLYSNLFLRNSK